MGRKDLKAKIRLEGDSKGATRAIGKVQKSFSGMASKLKVGAFAVVGALASMAGALKAIEAAGERLGQKRSLERTLTAQGIAIDGFVGKLKGLANNQIATSDIILASNRALALGISSDDLPGLLEAATKASVALGISATQAFNDITTGVGRASPLILDNLGIVVDATKIYKEMAASIGVSVEELTKQQKTAALSAAVMENAAKGAEDFATAQSKVTVAIAKSKTALKEWYERTLDAIAQNKALAVSIEETTDAVSDFATGLGVLAEAFGDVKKEEDEFVGRQKLMQFWIDLNTAGLSFAVRAIRELGDSRKQLNQAEKDALENIGKLTERRRAQADAIWGTVKATEGLTKAQDEAAARTARIEAALNKEATALSKLAAALGEVTQIELEKELNDITKALDEARESTDGNSDAFTRYEEIARQKSESIILRLRGIRDGLGDVGEDAARASLGFNKLGDAIDKAGDALDDTGDSFDSLSVSVRDTNSALSDQALQAKATGRELKHLTALNEQLALAEARTALAATQEERKNITGIGGINRDNSTGKYGLSEFGTGGTLRVNPDGTLRPA
jgi:uncharacterized protein YoxC